ncbi:hypothetical protein MF265_06650 [Serratia marcescens]|uniref:head fiber protein n=1 Tax=Serratia marcescens TaxID=615 RepID=UPI001EEFFA96|nr:head fiber protein [Serratia marcescens]ULH12435.1 hypothetical protein MF265_06650 [Serratia marcescens]
MAKKAISASGYPMEVLTPGDIPGSTITVSQISDATDTGKALLKASDGEAAMKSLENADGDITLGSGLVFKAAAVTDEHIIEFRFGDDDGKADASIMANANAQGGAIALAVRGENDPVPVNIITLTAAGAKNLIIGHPDFSLHVGKAQVDISNITAFAKSVVECATAEALRTLIGGGTSNLAIGTTATTAKAGNWTPESADLPAATTGAIGGVKMAAAMADLTAAPTQADFNGLLAKLRASGALAP